MTKRLESRTERFSTDEAIWMMAGSLVEDLLPYVDNPSINSLALALRAKDARRVRDFMKGISLDRFTSEPLAFKANYQLLNFLKKYMFESDMYTPEQLIEESKKKFLDNQERLLAIESHSYSDETTDVLGYAKGWIEGVLGDYNILEHLESSKFGKRATVGVPMHRACESARLDVPISGSREHIIWFDKIYLSYHGQMREYLYRNSGELYQECSSLTAVLVPKTWKSLRMIMPNTTIGSLYSSGLGKLTEKRLRLANYDIKSLQTKHREMAMVASKTGCYVTADQSLASDNIVSKLLKRIVPQRWFDAYASGRIEELSLYGDTLKSPTFMTMGIGFTFPLQTLVFLGLLKGCAIAEGQPSACVSAYGDDLIYETSLHDRVSRTFADLGLLMNSEKTFSEGGFRESCGGDYYRGTDVRPWHAPEKVESTLSRRKYQAFLYKSLNGLLRRWQIQDVPSTVRIIVDMLKASHTGDKSPVFAVPFDYPDTAGVRCLGPLSLRKQIPEIEMPIVDVHGVSRFRYLAFQPEYREEHIHEPYIWNSLRSGSRLDPFIDNINGRGRLLPGSSGWDSDIPPSIPLAEKHVESRKGYKPRSYYAMVPQGAVHGPTSVLVPVLTQVDKGRYTVQTGVTGSWT